MTHVSIGLNPKRYVTEVALIMTQPQNGCFGLMSAIVWVFFILLSILANIPANHHLFLHTPTYVLTLSQMLLMHTCQRENEKIRCLCS